MENFDESKNINESNFLDSKNSIKFNLVSYDLSKDDDCNN